MLRGPAGALVKAGAPKAMTPFLESMFGPMGALISAGDGRPDNSASDMSALTKAFAEARANKAFGAQARALANRVDQPSVPLTAQGAQNLGAPMAPPAPPPGAPGAPSVPVSLPNNSPPKPAAPQLPWWATGNAGQMFPGAAPAAPPAPVAPPTMGQRFAHAHPHTASTLGIGQPPAAAAPQAPSPQPMGFFARNTAMMRDPVGGDFIDPMAAAQAQAQTGPGLISKMMSVLNNKAQG